MDVLKVGNLKDELIKIKKMSYDYDMCDNIWILQEFNEAFGDICNTIDLEKDEIMYNHFNGTVTKAQLQLNNYIVILSQCHGQLQFT